MITIIILGGIFIGIMAVIGAVVIIEDDYNTLAPSTLGVIILLLVVLLVIAINEAVDLKKELDERKFQENSSSTEQVEDFVPVKIHRRISF